jgi:hypothetical protein
VAGLLEGEGMWIEPKGFAETHARGNLEQHRLQRADKWVPYGVGAIEGSAVGVEGRRELPVLPDGARREYGPGEEPRPREGEPTASVNHELL